MIVDVDCEQRVCSGARICYLIFLAGDKIGGLDPSSPGRRNPHSRCRPSSRCCTLPQCRVPYVRGRCIVPSTPFAVRPLQPRFALCFVVRCGVAILLLAVVAVLIVLILVAALLLTLALLQVQGHT